jgi:hypothetical protein
MLNLIHTNLSVTAYKMHLVKFNPPREVGLRVACKNEIENGPSKWKKILR